MIVKRDQGAEGGPRKRFAFIVELALGHRTHAENLQMAMSKETHVEAAWGLIRFDVAGTAARLPLYSNWTVRAGLRARRALRAIARAGPIDALFIHTQVPAVLNVDWVRRVPTVVSLDATPMQYDELGEVYDHGTGPDWLESAKWRLNRRALHAAAAVVTWSEWARKGVIDAYAIPPERVTAIPPGVHTKAWARPSPRTPHSGPLRVLFVGGDATRKGAMTLIEAVRALRPRLPVELDIVTREPIPAGAGVRLHHGVVSNTPEMRRLFHEADVFCLPTKGDCMPLVLAEAAASGLPSIATRVGGIPELVLDGQTGLLIPPVDATPLAAAIERLARDPALRLSMGERAAGFAQDHHDSGTNARRILEVLLEACAAGRGERRPEPMPRALGAA
jgi:glycosyltransferase involved in cell wall biosynthesis